MLILVIFVKLVTQCAPLAAMAPVVLLALPQGPIHTSTTITATLPVPLALTSQASTALLVAPIATLVQAQLLTARAVCLVVLHPSSLSMLVVSAAVPQGICQSTVSV